MIYLSASLIKDVLQCTKKGYWRRNYPEDSQQTEPQEFGENIHKCLELYWNKPLKFMMESLPDTDLMNDNKSMSYSFLKNFIDNFKQYCSSDDKTEEKFFIPIKDNYAMVGRLDRVNIKSGIVLDWKAGNTVPYSINNDIQFIIYDWAFEKLYGKKANLVGFASLKTGSLIKYTRNSFYTDELFSVIIPKVVKMLETNSFSRDGMFKYPMIGRISSTCKNCQFKKACLE